MKKLLLSTFYAAINVAVNFSVKGYTLFTLFNWFISPNFNVPQISLQGAMGVLIIVSMMKFRFPKETEAEFTFNQLLKEIGNTILLCSITLLIGFIITSL